MAILVLVWFLSFQTSAVPIGMIFEAKGEVFLQRGGSKIPVKLADPLYPGDQVLAAAGQATFLFCPTAERVSIAKGARVELSGNAVVIRAGAAPIKTPARCTLPKVALGAENLERVGGMRARGNPPAALFLGGPVTTARPVFEWAAVAGTVSYQLILRDSADREVWRQSTASTTAAYPENLSPLTEGGKYQWELRAEAGRKLLAEQNAAFEIKTNAQLARAPGDDMGSILAHAFELEDAGYLAEAAAAYRALQKSYPDDMRIARRLAVLYWNAGLIAAYNELNDRYKIKPQ